MSQQIYECICKSGTYWIPLVDIPNIEALFLMDIYLEPYEDKIAATVRSVSLDKMYRIDETEDDCETEAGSFSLQLHESLWCDSPFDWIV